MVSWIRLAAALSVAVVAFFAAWRAMLPGVAFWDTGELQVVGPLMGTAHPTGFPTYVLLGWLASVGGLRRTDSGSACTITAWYPPWVIRSDLRAADRPIGSDTA